MSEMIESPRVINLGKQTKNRKSGTTLQLTFHIPEGMKVSADLVLEMSQITEPTLLVKDNVVEVLSEPKVALESAQEIVAKPELTSLASPVVMESELTPVVVESTPEVADVRIHIKEASSDIIPFFSLKLKNAPSVYKTGTTFLKDVANGKKHFGFASMSKQLDELHLLVYASFINYSLKKPVLVVVKDLNDKAFDKYRSNFTEGTLWKWQTYDWGDLCLIDYKQINQYAEEFKHLDLSFITEEFVSILWALPSGNVQDELHKSTLVILNKINSVTFVIRSGETKNNDLKKSAAYYQCFDIPVKGILVGESTK